MKLLRLAIPAVAMCAVLLAPSGSAAATTQGHDVGPAAYCTTTAGKQTIERLCGWVVLRITDDNRSFTYVVGLNHQIYTAYQRFPGDTTWAPWTSLGGYAAGNLARNNNVHHGIKVLGSDNRIWCNTLSGGSWSGWYYC